MTMYGQNWCISLHADEGRESQTKDFMYNTHLTELFAEEKKCALYTGEYGVIINKKNLAIILKRIYISVYS